MIEKGKKIILKQISWSKEVKENTKQELNATLYISDQHFGEVNPHRKVLINKFQQFIEEYGLNITEISDLGDGIGCDLLSKSLKKTSEEIKEINEKEAWEVIDFFNILSGGWKANVMLGNHQLEIVEWKVTEEAVKKAKEISKKRLQNYLKKEIKPKTPEIKFNVTSGIKQTEENVIVEHGMYYDVFSTVKKILKEFRSNMTIEEKLEIINANPEIEIELQKFWQKMKANWWIIQRLGEKNYEPLFDIFHALKDIESWLNHLHFKKGIPFSYSHNEHVLKQLELMEKLANKEKLVMVSGHRHRKDAQAKDYLLSISLGDWGHPLKTPSCALHTPYLDKKTGEKKDRWIIAEYVRYDDQFDPNFEEKKEKWQWHWRILKEFVFNEKENKWKELYKTSLKTTAEKSIWDKWAEYEIEWDKK